MAADRFAPLADADWPAALADLRDGFAGGLNVYRTMARHPALLRAWAALRDHIVNDNALGPANSEVVILRAALRLGSDYEWRQHILRARRRGLNDARIRSLQGNVAEMAAGDGLLAGAVDELFTARRLAADTAAAIADTFGEAALLDLLATVGFYSTLGYVLTTCATPLDDDIAAALAATPLAGDLSRKPRHDC